MTFPWEQLPTTTEPAPAPAVRSTEDTVALLQRDFAYAVQYTAVLVHSTHDELKMLVNTARGQIIPRGVCKLNNAYGSDPHTIEFQDIGMCQPGAPVMTVAELMARVWGIASDLGLEIAT